MSGTSKKMKQWKVLTAAVVLAVGFFGAPQGAGAATAVSGTGTSITVGEATYDITYNSGGATASGTNAIAVGESASAEANSSIAVGYVAEATSDYAIAVGGSSSAQEKAVAVGNGATAAYWATAVGYGAKAEGTESTASGYIAQATGHYSVAIGTEAKATSTVTEAEDDLEGVTIAIGAWSEASGNYSMAFGPLARATDFQSIAIGVLSVSSGDSAVALGKAAEATGYESMALGIYAKTYKEVVEGTTTTQVNADGAIAVGPRSTASGRLSSTLGYSSQATEQQALAAGFSSAATGVGSVALGSMSQASNTLATATGYSSNAGGTKSSAFGTYSYAGGEQSSAIGAYSTAGGDRSLALGYYATASATNAVAIGTEAANATAGTVSFGHKSGDFSGWYTNEAGTAQSRTKTDDYNVEVYYASDSFARLTNIAYGTDNHDAAAYGQIVNAKALTTDATTGNVTSVTPYTFDNTGLATIYANNGGIAFQLQLPSGSISSGDTGAGYVKGSELYTELRKDVSGTNSTISSTQTTAENLKALDTAIGNVKLDNSAVYTFDKDNTMKEIKYADGTTTAFTIQINGLGEGGSGGTTYTAGNGIVIDATGETHTISANVAEKGGLSVDKDGLAVKVAEKGGLSADENGLSVKVAENGGLTVDDNGLSVQKDGKVESGNTGLVTGGTVYDAMKSMDNQVTQLSNDINKVGAGAAALAALRPEAFNPGDRWSFAVGYGHYKNANAGALGAFYKPNEDTTVSLGGTIGNGDPMMNAGVSFKLGSRSKKAGTYQNTKDLASRINAIETAATKRDTVIAAQAKELAAVKANSVKEIAALRADNEKMKKQIAQILSKMEMADKVKKTAK